MHLSPDDIANRSFTVTHRGYDRSEVHAFLVQVARQVRISPKGDGVIDLRSAEAATKVIEAAEREAEAIVAEAMKTRAEADTYAASIRLHADGVGQSTVPAVPEPTPAVETSAAADVAPTSPLSEQRFAELLDAERDIVSRLESTSHDLQQTYGTTTPVAPIPPAPPRSADPVAQLDPVVRPDPPTRDEAAPTAPAPTPADITSSIEVDDELEVVKKASDLLDGVLDDVMGSLRSDGA